MFLASMTFFLTFGCVRGLILVTRGRAGAGLVIGGVHVHHLVWGIVLLLAVGYLWLIQLDGPSGRPSIPLGRLTAILYGAGAALTLDEFALWLRLNDVYWQREGRASIDAIALFGALVSAGLWGKPFLRSVTGHAARLAGGRAKHLLPLGSIDTAEPAPAPPEPAGADKATLGISGTSP